ncbi:hypothetical protein PV327_008997 [Microctonus hyperodae]|uniref:Uncharacterized protein n=1 Tax=Microctonus hyperodae TaxID=165561 RepID=A0AA39FTH0_MICHY|nr:hypothetical protein PV327_008997 [Microctonus hyperodae]
MKLWTKKLVILGTTGIFLITIGIVVGFFWDNVYNFFNKIINDNEIEMENNSNIFYIGVTILIIGVIIFIITMIEIFIRSRSRKFEIFQDDDLNNKKNYSTAFDAMSISDGHYWKDRLI